MPHGYGPDEWVAPPDRPAPNEFEDDPIDRFDNEPEPVTVEADYPWLIQMDTPGAGWGSLSIATDRAAVPGVSVFLLTPDEMVTLAHHILAEFEIHAAGS